MEDPKFRPIPESERPFVRAMLMALYAGEESTEPGNAPAPVPISQPGLRLVEKIAS